MSATYFVNDDGLTWVCEIDDCVCFAVSKIDVVGANEPRILCFVVTRTTTIVRYEVVPDIQFKCLYIGCSRSRTRVVFYLRCTRDWVFGRARARSASTGAECKDETEYREAQAAPGKERRGARSRSGGPRLRCRSRPGPW